jgi:hypothetical protein
MRIFSKTALLTAAAATLAASAPANAQFRGPGSGGPGGHDRGGISAGEVIAGVAILGGIAAIASASSSSRGYRDDRGYDRGYDHGHGRRDQPIYDRGYNDRGYGEREAIGQCIRAAQQEARRYGNARVTQVTDIDEYGRGFQIRGTVVSENRDWGRRGYDGYDRYGYGNDRYRNDYDRGRFTCTVNYGRVQDVRISGLNRGW